MNSQEKFDKLYNQQMDKFSKEENEKKIYRQKVKELVSSGIPRILAISYAKHGFPI